MGEQLELSLGLARVPWAGTSPRALTRAARSPIFKAQAVKDARFRDPAQMDLFGTVTNRAPWVYQGAPLLKEV